MSKTTDDAYERIQNEGGVLIQTRTRAYYADRDIGDEVHLKNRPEPLAGIITGLEVWPTGCRYMVRWGDGTEGAYFPIELQDSPEL